AIASAVSSVSFFFQAEDGIRGRNVTGVQTCALPISPPADCRRGGGGRRRRAPRQRGRFGERGTNRGGVAGDGGDRRLRAVRADRSEERRVGEGGRSGWRRWRAGAQRKTAVERECRGR